VTYSDYKLSAYGVPFLWWSTDVKPTDDTVHYFEKYLGYAHDHEWTGGGYSRSGLTFVACGACSYGPYQQHQRRLTSIGFQLVAASGIQDANLRRSYFESIIHPEGSEHYFDVLMTHDLIDRQLEKQPAVKRRHYRIWSANMHGIEIPEAIQSGQLVSVLEH